MQKQFDNILQKRMDRKDFLKHVALGVAVVTGVAGVIKLIKPEAVAQQRASLGYGASVYGGHNAAERKS